VRHRLGLATRTQISVCKLPFPSAGTAVQCPCSVRKRFSRDHCCRGRSKPGCLGVTRPYSVLQRTLEKTAGKLKNRNNLLMKLAGSTWGASVNTLWSSALALCYSAAEYCVPVWSCSAHTSQVNVQLNSTMHLIAGTLHSAPLSWLPVLSNIEPPAL